MIKTHHLFLRYPRAHVPALRDLSLQIAPGESVLLLGPSGGGKSTLAHLLAGLIPQNLFAHTQGEVQVDGLDPRSAPPGQTATRVGLLFQDPEASFATLTVEDEIAFGLENLRLSPSEMPARIAMALKQVGLSEFGHRRLDTLSGGEAQRVALAALLAMQPPILVLDEPTANLDPRATREFFAFLDQLRAKHTILLIEHKLEACQPLAERLILLDGNGALMADGRPEEIFSGHLEAILQAGIWTPETFAPLPTPHLPSPPPPDAPLAVRIRRLNFAYADHAPVLRGVNLDIRQGEFFALVGPNGSGKSTLAQLSIGLLPHTHSGEIRLFGERVEDLSLAELTERAGYVFQNPEHQFVTDTVWDELAYSLRARRWNRARVHSRVEELLTHFGLTAHRQQNPFTLSQGQKRRLSVGTMLVAGQRLLILDEPTFGQDRRTALALMSTLADLNRQGVTLLMITHDMRLVKQYAHRVAVLLEGQIAFSGPPQELFAHQDLLERARLI